MSYFSLEKVESLFAVCKVSQSTIDVKQVCNCQVEQHIIVHTGKRPYHNIIPGTLGLGKERWTDVVIYGPPTAVNNMKIRQIYKLFANKKRIVHVKPFLLHSHAQVPLEVFIGRTRMKDLFRICVPWLNRRFKPSEKHSCFKHNLNVSFQNRLILARNNFIQFLLCQGIPCSRFEDSYAVVMT